MSKRFFSLILPFLICYQSLIFARGFIDGGNSTTTALGGNSTFTGNGIDVSEYSSLIITLYGTASTATGTLHLDFSPDNTNWDYTKSFTVSDLTKEPPHTISPVNQYFRVRYVNDSAAQSTFRLQALYHTEKQSESNPSSGVKSTDNSSTANVGGQTTINEGGQLGSGDTSIIVTDASVFDNNTTIKIDSEYMSITNIAGNTLTVTRGAFNSTATTHEDGATVTGVYIGTPTLNEQPDVMVSLKSNTAGTEYFDFSNDGVNWDTFPVSGFTVAANTHAFHTGVKGRRYFRVRFENGSALKTTDFRVNTYFGVYRQSNLPLNQTINADADSTVVRAFQVGQQPDGDFVNGPADGVAFSTTSTLAGGATYTSSWVDADGYNLIDIYINSDVVSATDGIAVDFTADANAVTPTTEFTRNYTFATTDITNGYKIITIPTELDGFRIRYTNGGTIQGSFRLEATLKTNGLFNTTKLNAQLNDDNDSNIVRSIIVGKTVAGNYQNVTLNNDGTLGVAFQASVGTSSANSAFGELLSVSPTPIFSTNFVYQVNPETLSLFENNGGTITTSNSLATIATGTNTTASAELVSKTFLQYSPGEGSLVRFTALFTTGVANSTQYIGLGNSANGLFFGYNGTQFGILRRTGGAQEVRTLTITTKSSHAENITITLDGVAKTDVAVTNGADTTVTANEIAAADYSEIGKGWSAYAEGSTVIFVSWDSIATHTGSYSLSGATSAVGTFAQTIAGIAPTETFTAQSSWNIDTFDGTGPSEVTLDPTQGNVYQIRYQWLGFGAMIFAIENAETGLYQTAHVIQYANTSTTPSLKKPSLPFYIGVHKTAGASDISIKSASAACFNEGRENVRGVFRGKSETKTLGTANETPILTIKNKLIFQNQLNEAKVKIKRIFAAIEHTKPVTINFYSNPTLVGSSFQSLGSTSLIQTDTIATSFSGGTLLTSIPLGKSSSTEIDLSLDNAAAVLQPGSHFTATAKPNSGTNAEVTVSLNTVEFI